MPGDIDLDWARRTLRPTAEEAVAAWRALVTAERQQVEQLRNRPRPGDFYGPVAESFRADPRRTDEPALEQIRRLVRPDETWIDVGAGGGRYTLPIALLARHLYAVEPSAGMRETLLLSAREHGITNLDVIDERWPCVSKAPVADVAFISHVGYDIADIGRFLEQMEAHARRLCVALLFERAPISDFAPLWQKVHGEERALLPGLKELVGLLFARDRAPEVSLLQLGPRTYTDRAGLHAAVRRPLWVLPGTPEDARLAAAINELSVDVEGGVVLSQRERQLALVRWAPR
jgi:SAM-dependent methyltransferase